MTQLSQRDQTTTDIRIRSALIFILVHSVIALTSTYSSAAVELTEFIKYNKIVNAFNMVTTFVMISSMPVLAIILTFFSTSMMGTTTFLIFLSITKCNTVWQTKACYSTLLQDSVIGVLLMIVSILNLLQMISLNDLKNYLDLKSEPPVEQRILKRRIRLLHVWSMPFQIGIVVVQIILVANHGQMNWAIFIPLVLTPILAHISTEKLEIYHLVGLVLSIGVGAADTVNYFTSGKKPDTTYIEYKEWCLLTLMFFDILIIGIRMYLISYKKKIINFANAGVSKAKWEIKKFTNPPAATKKQS